MISWLLTTPLFIGNILLTKKMKAGWVVLFFTDVAWVIWGLTLGWEGGGFVMSGAINALIRVVGFTKWSNRKVYLTEKEFLDSLTETAKDQGGRSG